MRGSGFDAETALRRSGIPTVLHGYSQGILSRLKVLETDRGDILNAAIRIRRRQRSLRASLRLSVLNKFQDCFHSRVRRLCGIHREIDQQVKDQQGAQGGKGQAVQVLL